LSATLSLYASNKFFGLGTITYDCASASFQQVVVPGISGATKPTFSPILGVLTQDGAVVWISLDPPTVNILVALPPSGPNTPPAPPSAPKNPRITSET
jgi:hypothetical protein